MTKDEVRKVVDECNLIDCIDDAYIDRDDWKPIVERFAALTEVGRLRSRREQQ